MTVLFISISIYVDSIEWSWHETICSSSRIFNRSHGLLRCHSCGTKTSEQVYLVPHEAAILFDFLENVHFHTINNWMHSHKWWTYSTHTTNTTDSLLHIYSVECWNVLHSSEGTAQMLRAMEDNNTCTWVHKGWVNKWKQAVQMHYRSCSDVQLSLNIQYSVYLKKHVSVLSNNAPWSVHGP